MSAGLRGYAEEAPRNTAGSLTVVDGTLTPANLFFVREHFAQPALSLASWSLRVDGYVEAPFEMSFSDLLVEISVQREYLLECAGNGPAGYAVSNGLWEGVRLADLLARAKPRSGAAEVLLEGTDAGKLHPSSAGFPYARIVPLEKCQEPESLVAFKLNGRFLPRRNGFPARAVFPGWYGMDWVKWLRRIVVLAPNERPPAFYESGMTEAYIRVLQTAGGAQQIQRISELNVKSQIAEPTNNSRLTAGLKMIRGFAWTGGGRISSVQVSVNSGAVWEPATLDKAPRPQTWVPWSYRWRAEPGSFVLMSRASDDRRRQQPLAADERRKDSYELNHCAPVKCEVS
jgi:DMSO/TMAO reductase YedYZ molybdopterin-dependent catalytic subunit